MKESDTFSNCLVEIGIADKIFNNNIVMPF